MFSRDVFVDVPGRAQALEIETVQQQADTEATQLRAQLTDLQSGQSSAASQAQLQLATMEREVANLTEHLNRVEADADRAQQASRSSIHQWQQR